MNITVTSFHYLLNKHVLIFSATPPPFYFFLRNYLHGAIQANGKQPNCWEMNTHSEMQIIESSTRKLLPGSLGKTWLNKWEAKTGGGCTLLHLVTGKKPSETLGKDCSFSSPVLGVSGNMLVSSGHSQSWKTDQHTTRVSTSSTESFLHSRYKLHMLLMLFWFTASVPCSAGAVMLTHMFQAYKRLSCVF